MRRFAVVVLNVVIGVASFSPAAAAAGGTSTAPIVGRWQQSHSCDELVSALDALGLGALAPGVVGDYFPNRPPKSSPQNPTSAQEQCHSSTLTSSRPLGSSARWISSRTKSMTARM